MNTKNKIAFGTAAIGRPSYINIKNDDSPKFTDINSFKNKGIELLTNAWRFGITHFDTSPGYGIAEDLILAFLNENEPKNFSISTKWGYTYVANFDLNAKQHEIKEHSLQKLNEQWEKSKLLLPYLNLYQIHSVTPESDVLDNSEILNRLFEIKMKNNIEIGITTSGVFQNEVIVKALGVEIAGEALFSSFQVTYNILDQSLADLKNKLTGKNLIIKEAMANGRIFRNKNYPHYNELYSELEILSNKYKVGTDAIALRFCMDSFEDSMVLSGAKTENQLKQNLKALEITLAEQDFNKLQSFGISRSGYWSERKKLEWVS